MRLMRSFKSLGDQRLYGLAALYAKRRFTHWKMTVGDLAGVMGRSTTRRDNFSTAVEKACEAVARHSLEQRVFQHAPIYTGKTLAGWDFELVPRALDISRTGKLPQYENRRDALVPSGWQQCLRRQIERLKAPRRKGAARSRRFQKNLEQTEIHLIKWPKKIRQELELVSPYELKGAVRRFVEFDEEREYEIEVQEFRNATARGEVAIPPLPFIPDKYCFRLSAEAAAEREREWDEKLARGEDPDPIGTFLDEVAEAREKGGLDPDSITPGVSRAKV
jgi:hypothetical protein